MDTRFAALARRDIWSPGILSPNASDVWTAGSLVEIRWCVLSSVLGHGRPISVNVDVARLEQGYHQPACASHKLHGEGTPGARAGPGR